MPPPARAFEKLVKAKILQPEKVKEPPQVQFDNSFGEVIEKITREGSILDKLQYAKRTDATESNVEEIKKKYSSYLEEWTHSTTLLLSKSYSITTGGFFKVETKSTTATFRKRVF